ncbi:MAG: sugar ABC transporter ATP-binding protein [Microbacteriaceae bacterium]|nr:MAG: sugar ABC transporter ATP-binding protein [Microbacteriaceae bacterium]
MSADSLGIQARTEEPVLDANGITKIYGVVKALDNVDLQLFPGEVVALLGLNGAGKSTLVNILSGAEKATHGSMRLAGSDYSPKLPADAEAAGLKVVHQHRTLISHLTVADNVMLGNEPSTAGLISRKQIVKLVYDLANQFGVDIRPQANIDDLGAGELQMVDILKGLRSPGSVLLLDEPTAALSQQERETLFALIAKLKETGLAILFVSHQLDEVFRICDRIVCLRDGRVVSDRKVVESDISGVVTDIVGEENVSAFYRKVNYSPGDAVVEVHSTRPGESPLTLRAGEVVGLAGVVGSGCTELIEFVSGSRPSANRSLVLRGKPVHYRSPAAARGDRLVLLPEKRQVKGIWERLSIRENVSMGNLDRASKGWFTLGSRESKLVKELTGPLKVKAPSMSARVSSLSGGNQQKVVFARVAGQAQERSGAVFCFDEPTEGIDVRTKPEIAAEICNLADQGSAVLVASSDLDELIGMTDRIYIMREGTVVGVLPAEPTNRERIVGRMLSQTHTPEPVPSATPTTKAGTDSSRGNQ